LTFRQQGADQRSSDGLKLDLQGKLVNFNKKEHDKPPEMDLGIGQYQYL
jgi:hypothetical protein